jgi:hypothetical protein
MNIVVFDTETINTEKPFCYNIGYVIYDTENKVVKEKKDFVVEQVWHNDMLYTTAYFSNKREIYVARMRARKTIMNKFGYICQEMVRDFDFYNVKSAYAYNSPFDVRVFSYNCEWFKCNNPFDNIEIYDIRGYVHKKLAFLKEYQDFCEENKLFTENGHFSTTAETVFRFIKQDMDFVEEHTALADSLIELEILNACVDLGCEYDKKYKTYQSIKRNIDRELEINLDGCPHIFKYRSRRNSTDGNKIILKSCESVVKGE